MTWDHGKYRDTDPVQKMSYRTIREHGGIRETEFGPAFVDQCRRLGEERAAEIYAFALHTGYDIKA